MHANSAELGTLFFIKLNMYRDISAESFAFLTRAPGELTYWDGGGV